MPITKVPVVHKFGIISHNQRLELQQRLIRKTYEESHPTNRSVDESKRNPLEVSDAFVKAFNEASSYADKQKLENTAEVMLERLKRKAGIRNGGTSSTSDLDSAWTDLAALLQCRGRIQEVTLDIVIVTLDQAPLDPSLIPGVFFLAETVLYWLRTEAMQSPYLRTWEIKLLKIGQMVFMRLYYYHMVGFLQNCRPFKNRLYTYLHGLPGYQSTYSSYPNAHLFLRYMIEVGNILLADDDIDPGDVKEGDSVLPVLKGALQQNVEEKQSTANVASTMPLDLLESDPDMRVTLSHSVHDLTPTLWHSLDVWRCCQQCPEEVEVALGAVLKCGVGLYLESWIDVGCALTVLGEASKLRLDVLKALQRLAQGQSPEARYQTPSTGNDDCKYPTTPTTLHSPGATPSLIKDDRCSSADNGEDADDDDAERAASASVGAPTGAASAMQPSLGSATAELEQRVRELTPLTFANSPVPVSTCGGGLASWRWEVACMYAEILCNAVLHGTTSAIQKRALMGRHEHVDSIRPHDRLQESAGLVDLLAFHPNNARDGRPIPNEFDKTSGPNGLSKSKQQHPVSPPSGSSSSNREEPFEETVPEASEQQKQKTPGHGGGHDDDWTWRVRYSAVQSLVHICQCLRDDELRSGLRHAAFAALLRAQNNLERDTRVLEALKVGQASAKIENTLHGKAPHAPGTTARRIVAGQTALTPRPAVAPLTAVEPTDVSSVGTLGSKLASALSDRYLPPVHLRAHRLRHQPTITVRSDQSGRSACSTKLAAGKQQQQPRPAAAAGAKKLSSKSSPTTVPMRTSIREELTFAASGAAHLNVPDFNTRTSIDLRRIVEDQWRKELHQQLQEEETNRLQQLEKNRKLAANKSVGPAAAVAGEQQDPDAAEAAIADEQSLGTAAG